MKDGQVSFRYKNYKTGENSNVMSLDTSEFMRRFLMHTLPKNFVRIRYYGFLANRQRNENLELCRKLLGVSVEQAEPMPEANDLLEEAIEPIDACPTCPVCKRGKLRIIDTLPPPQPVARPHMLAQPATFATWFDTS